MIKCIEFPEKTFENPEDMFLALKANEQKIIGLKKAQVYKSCEKGGVSFLNLDATKSTGIIKTSFDIKADHIYPVISTTRYMDSHKDVHFDGCFTKTVAEQKGKVHYALDHQLKFDSIITWPKDVKMFVSSFDWALVGKDYPGQTEGLVFDIAKTDVRPDVLIAIENKAGDFENSIRMGYEKIKLAVNSTNKDLKENKDYYDSRINDIANKEQAEKDGYFWGVEELRIHKEGSLVVAGGSNDATGIIISEAADSTSDNKNEPQHSTQESTKFINPNIY